MGLTPRIIKFNPPRNIDGPSIRKAPAKKTSRKAENTKELEKRQAHARKLWLELIEKRDSKNKVKIEEA